MFDLDYCRSNRHARLERDQRGPCSYLDDPGADAIVQPEAMGLGRRARHPGYPHLALDYPGSAIAARLAFIQGRMAARKQNHWLVPSRSRRQLGPTLLSS